MFALYSWQEFCFCNKKCLHYTVGKYMYLKDMYTYICIVYLHCSVNFVDLLPLIISNNLRNLICMGHLALGKSMTVIKYLGYCHICDESCVFN